ncbi:MAG: hypothetical protein R3B68_04655 [Phycisphaerales bacterium]
MTHTSPTSNGPVGPRQTGAAPSPAGPVGGVAARGQAPVVLPRRAAGLRRWLRVSGAAGIAISMAFHVMLLSAAALVVLAAQPDDGESAAAPVQFAVLNESELAELGGGTLDTASPEVPDASPTNQPEIEINVPDTLGLESMREALSTNLGGSGDGAGDIGAGGDGLGFPGSGGGAGGGSGAGFFGVEAAGNRFAYIVDVSGSMAIGGKMDAMRSELLRSINAMQDQHSFIVVPFSTDAAPLGGRTGWIEATDRGKSWTRRAAMDLQPVGGTNPSPGFFYVFSQRPRPDAIYFLTDGEFGPEVAAEIAGLNAQADVPIHCIAFGTREAEPLMRRIAQQSGGTYTFVALGGIP